MSFAQPFPWPVTLLALAAIAVLTWTSGWAAGRHVGPPASAVQRAMLVALRATTLLLLLAIVQRPVRLLPDPTARGAYTVLIDVSRSMGLTDDGRRSRLAAARTLIKERIEPALSGRVALQVVAFGDEARRVAPGDVHDLTATDSATDISQALELVHRHAASEPVSGVLLISDGGFVLPGRGVEPLAVPVNAVGVGDYLVRRDQEVRQITVGEASVVGSMVDLTATVAATGYAGAAMELRLLADGLPVDVRRVVPAGESVPTEVVFRVAPEAATATSYTVELVTRDGELTADNNRRSVLVAPPGRPRRVLLIEGAPGYEHSFLKRALDRDPALEVDAVIRKGPNDAGDETFYVQAAAARGGFLSKGFPATREQLYTYDAVVLANVEVDVLARDQLQALADFVGERGGGLIVLGSRTLGASGVSGTVLEELLPVALSDRQGASVVRAAASTRPLAGVSLSADGERHPVMRLGATLDETRARWALLPPLPAVASVGDARPGATVLAWTSGPAGVARPLVVVQRFGRGRVLAFSGEGAWRWRMMLPAADLTYATFWRQAARWVASVTREPVSVQTHSRGPGRLEVTVDARDREFQPVRDADVQLTVQGADGTSHTVVATPTRGENGIYHADLRAPSGVVRVAVSASAQGSPLGRADAWALVGPDQDELTAPRRNDAQLARLAEQFGGTLISESELADVVGASRASTAPAVMTPRDLWHSPWVLATLMMLMAAEWALRRQWGLR